MSAEIPNLPDREYWEMRAGELRSALDGLQQRFDEGQLPPADDIEALDREIRESIQPDSSSGSPSSSSNMD